MVAIDVHLLRSLVECGVDVSEDGGMGVVSRIEVEGLELEL